VVCAGGCRWPNSRDASGPAVIWRVPAARLWVSERDRFLIVRTICLIPQINDLTVGDGLGCPSSNVKYPRRRRRWQHHSVARAMGAAARLPAG